MGISVTPASRIDYDDASRAIRSWYDPNAKPVEEAHFDPMELAREALSESASLFQWEPDLADLRPADVIEAQQFSVRFSQEFKGLPVDDSEVVVDIMPDGRIYSVYNHYHYDIPQELDPEAKVARRRAKELVQRLFRGFEDLEVNGPELIVYQYHPAQNRPPKPIDNDDQLRKQLDAAVGAHLTTAAGAIGRPEEGQYFLAWDASVVTQQPPGNWRVLVDADTGSIVNVIDLAQYATGTASVFDPNPTVTTGDLTLTGSSPIGTLDAQRVPVNVDRLNAPVGGVSRLDGQWVQMEEFELPTFAEPTSATADFAFSFSDRNFLASMCYFHIDRFQDYVQSVLGITNACNFSIGVDPQGFNGADNSHYLPATKKIAFGEGGVPDDSDAHVILHEYGHAIQDSQNPGFSGYTAGVSEGFGDFLAAVYYDDKHVNPSATRGLMMCWDASPFGGATASWPGRRYDVAWLFGGPEWNAANGHERGQLWCATMFEIYRKLGGDSGYPGVRAAARDLIIRLHLQANAAVPSSPTTRQMAEQVEAADGNLGGWRYANGLHKKVVYDTFRRRQLSGFPDNGVDVYVDDGRAGGYGSPSGNDLFSENLWDENFWDTQDIWVRTTPYANAAAQAAGGPADHVEPPVGSTAYLYVRVKNRGTSAGGSGPVTVKAFHCLPAMGLVWPSGWTSMDTPSIAVSNVAPGATGTVVGPFDWTPTEVGHECVLVIVECANDRAVTQDLLPTDTVSHSDLVPFDNNIAQRNLVPTGPKGATIRGFYVANPYPEPHLARLHFDDALPRGWQWRVSPEQVEAIDLGPLERRWVEVSIEQAEGEEVTSFDDPRTLTVTGTIEDRVIGGMTFYLAPPSTFRPSPMGPRRKPRVVCPEDLLCLNLPWDDLDVEGELELRIRFSTHATDRTSD